MGAPPLNDQLRALARATRRLAAEQGPRARRNARRRVALALAAVRRALDEQFPAPGRTGRELSADPADKRRRWEKAGWRVPGLAELEKAAIAGVRVRRLPAPNAVTYAPGWLWAIGRANAAGLRRAKRDREYRAAMLVAWRTTGQEQ